MFKTFKLNSVFFPYKPSSIASSRVSFLAASPTIPFFPLQERNQFFRTRFIINTTHILLGWTQLGNGTTSFDVSLFS